MTQYATPLRVRPSYQPKPGPPDSCRPQHATGQRRLISVGGVQVIDNLAFVPDVIAGGDDINAEFEQLFGNLRSNAEATCGVLAVSDGQFNAVLPL